MSKTNEAPALLSRAINLLGMRVQEYPDGIGCGCAVGDCSWCEQARAWLSDAKKAAPTEKETSK